MPSLCTSGLGRATGPRVAATLLLLGACAGDDKPSTSASPTWWADVKPITDRRCASCHADGEIAPFSITDYEQASAWAGAIADAVEARRMPPWSASGDCNTYQYDPSLSDDEIAVLVAWADGGAPEGDAAEAVDVEPPETPTLSRTDLELNLPEPYTPISAPDDYRCLVLDWPAEEQTFVTGFQVVPDQRSIVHHALIFGIPPEMVSSVQALDEADPEIGYACYGGPGGDTFAADDYSAILTLGAWAPGAGGGDYPEGMGIPMEPGSKVVIQMHYNVESSPAVPDQSTVALKLDASVEHEGRLRPFTDPTWVDTDEMLIPAGSEDVSYSYSAAWPASVRVLGGTMHMHELGESARLTVTHADGAEECVVAVDPWDFHWQLMYGLEEPIDVIEGDSFNLTCQWDNPRDEDVTWGEGTSDEMCLAYFMAYKLEE